MAHKRKNAKHPVIVHGLYADLEKRKLDGRTRVVKAMKEARAGLMQLFPNGRVNAAASLIIDRVVYKALKLSLYEMQDLKGMSGISPESKNKYLEIANSMRDDLRFLTNLAARQSPEREFPDLSEYLETVKRAARAQVIKLKGETADD